MSDRSSDFEIENKSAITKFVGLLHRSKRPTLKEKLSTAIYLLDSTSNKLKAISDGLKKRDQKFIAKCVDAEIKNDHMRAVMYANECAEVRKLARLVISSELVLEQAALRLQTFNKLGDVLGTIVPIVELVEETKGRLGSLVPAVSDKLNDVNSVLKSSLSEMGSVGTFEDPSNNTSEAVKVLEEANLAAEEKIRERFPRLPEELTQDEHVNFRIPVALAATGGDLRVQNKSSLKQQVYEYIKASNGQISPKECASFLDVSLEDIETALLKLEKEGKIAA